MANFNVSATENIEDHYLFKLFNNRDLKGLKEAVENKQVNVDEKVNKIPILNAILCCAVDSSETEIFDYLLTLDIIDLNQPVNISEDSLLTYVCESSKIQYIPALMKKGADVNYRNCDNWTCLHKAASQNLSMTIFRDVLDNGADVNAITKDGETPLYLACLNGNVDWAHMLIYYGAIATITTNAGQLPLTAVCVNWGSRQKELQELLFYHTFDDVSIMIELPALVDSMMYDSSLVQLVSEVVYDAEGLKYFRTQWEKMDPESLQIFLRKFTNIGKKLFKDGSLFSELIELTSQRTKMMFLESEFVVELVQAIENKDLIIFMWLTTLYEKKVQLEEVTKIICTLVAYGIPVTDCALDMVYFYYGFCELFEILLHMDLVWYEFTQDYYFAHTGDDNSMACLYYNVTTELDYLLEFVPITVDLLNYFNHPRLKSRVEDEGISDNKIIDKLKSLPSVPLLAELSRDVARKYIIDRYGVKYPMQFYTIIKWLPVDRFTKDILIYKKGLY